jgi:hypothetical protein
MGEMMFNKDATTASEEKWKGKVRSGHEQPALQSIAAKELLFQAILLVMEHRSY